MATHKTAEESQKEYIEVMGEPLGKQFHALWQEVAWLYTKWGEYVALFGTKPSRIDLMNRTAPLFFRVVQDSIWEETILHIARLTDPPKSMGKENLSIQQLPLLVGDEGLRQTLSKKKAGTLVQIQLCIAKEKILTAARQRGYRVKQKLTLPNGRSRIHLDAKIPERFMT